MVPETRAEVVGVGLPPAVPSDPVRVVLDVVASAVLVVTDAPAVGGHPSSVVVLANILANTLAAIVVPILGRRRLPTDLEGVEADAAVKVAIRPVLDVDVTDVAGTPVTPYGPSPTATPVVAGTPTVAGQGPRRLHA